MRFFLRYFNTENLEFQSGSTMIAPTVTMDKIKPKDCQVVETLGDSRFLQSFRVVSKSLWQTLTPISPIQPGEMDLVGVESPGHRCFIMFFFLIAGCRGVFPRSDVQQALAQIIKKVGDFFRGEISCCEIW